MEQAAEPKYKTPVQIPSPTNPFAVAGLLGHVSRDEKLSVSRFPMRLPSNMIPVPNPSQKARHLKIKRAKTPSLKNRSQPNLPQATPALIVLLFRLRVLLTS